MTIGAPVVRGEMADPHQLYTRTTYLKGAEIFGMLRTILGPLRWRAVFDEFVRRFDLGAAGVDDFVALAQELVPDQAADIEGVARWFHLAGRPALRISTEQEADGTLARQVQRTDSGFRRRALPVAVSPWCSASTRSMALRPRWR